MIPNEGVSEPALPVLIPPVQVVSREDSVSEIIQGEKNRLKRCLQRFSIKPDHEIVKFLSNIEDVARLQSHLEVKFGTSRAAVKTMLSCSPETGLFVLRLSRVHEVVISCKIDGGIQHFLLDDAIAQDVVKNICAFQNRDQPKPVEFDDGLIGIQFNKPFVSLLDLTRGYVLETFKREACSQKIRILEHPFLSHFIQFWKDITSFQDDVLTRNPGKAIKTIIEEKVAEKDLKDSVFLRFTSSKAEYPELVLTCIKDQHTIVHVALSTPELKDRFFRALYINEWLKREGVLRAGIQGYGEFEFTEGTQFITVRDVIG